jgi:hypothetical protein
MQTYAYRFVLESGERSAKLGQRAHRVPPLAQRQLLVGTRMAPYLLSHACVKTRHMLRIVKYSYVFHRTYGQRIKYNCPELS